MDNKFEFNVVDTALPMYEVKESLEDAIAYIHTVVFYKVLVNDLCYIKLSHQHRE